MKPSEKSKITQRLPVQIQQSLSRIAIGLNSSNFQFIKVSESIDSLKDRIEKSDEDRGRIMNKILNLYIGLAGDTTAIGGALMKNIFSFNVTELDDTEFKKSCDQIIEYFPLSAFSVSKNFGPRFVPVVYDDGLVPTDLYPIIEKFQEINYSLLPIGGRIAFKILGYNLKMDSSAATGSLILIAPNTMRASMLQYWIEEKPIHSDTMVNQLKERFGRWQFWAKALVGFMEYKPHQLRQEIIIVNSETGRAKSSVFPRMWFEFGFKLSDISIVN